MLELFTKLMCIYSLILSLINLSLTNMEFI